MLATYASMLGVLTSEQEAGRLHLSPIAITSGGELLTPAAQRRAAAAFGCQVTQAYAASEAMPLALPCRHGRLHLNSDWFLVEPVDQQGRAVPAGTRSDGLLVTNLANYVQPVIRYQLGDSVVVSGQRCPCGSPFQTITVEGRTDEILRLAAPDGGAVVLVPMAVATVVEETPGVRRYQVVQTGPSSLTVRLEHDPSSDRSHVWERVDTRLSDLLRQHGAAGVQVRLATEPPQANPRSGKLVHVVRSPAAGSPNAGGRAGSAPDPSQT